MVATRLRVVHESHCPDIGPICDERDEPAQLHDQTLNIAELRAIVAYAWSSALSFETEIPVKAIDTGIIFRRLDGTPFVPDYGNIHHRNETLAGIGDIWLSARGSIELLGLRWSGLAGVTLPTGKTEEDPFALGEHGLEHQHLQFGTGTFDPLLGVNVTWFGGAARFDVYGTAQLSLYRNNHGYQAGNKLSFGFNGGVNVVPWLELAVTADLIHEQPERWQGEVQQDGNLGRTDVLLGGAVTARFEGFELTIGFRVPAFIRIVTGEHEHGEVTYPGILSLAISRTFDLSLAGG